MKLHYREFGSGIETLVVLHGLLGSSQNWQGVAKILGKHFRVMAVDQRNHGDSPHAPTHTFDDLREDLLEFFDDHALKRAHLLGHSMGGMAAMEFAFYHPERVAKLIIDDIAPRAYDSSSGEVLQALLEVDPARFDSRQEIDQQLASRIPNRAVRQFALTNLARDGEGQFHWRVNLPMLQKFQQAMAEYEAPLHARFDGETLFIGGERSPYHLDHEVDLILRHFPNSRLEMIPGAGHWVHFEAQDRFIESVKRFLGAA